MNRLERMLKDFDENQLREINKFLNSADGRRLKSHINSTDKDKYGGEQKRSENKFTPFVKAVYA